MGRAGRFLDALSAGSAATGLDASDDDADTLPLLCQPQLTGSDNEEHGRMGEFSGNAVGDSSAVPIKNGVGKRVDVTAKLKWGQFERAGGLHWFTTALFIAS